MGSQVGGGGWAAGGGALGERPAPGRAPRQAGPPLCPSANWPSPQDTLPPCRAVPAQAGRLWGSGSAAAQRPARLDLRLRHLHLRLAFTTPWFTSVSPCTWQLCKLHSCIRRKGGPAGAYTTPAAANAPRAAGGGPRLLPRPALRPSMPAGLRHPSEACLVGGRALEEARGRGWRASAAAGGSRRSAQGGGHRGGPPELCTCLPWPPPPRHLT